MRERLFEVIFGYETRAGQLFDIVLISTIVLSVVAVLLDSVAAVRERYHDLLYAAEWFFTILFTLEYALRLYSSPSRRGYVFSFFGIVDLLSILPSYLTFLFPGSQSLIVIRILRVLRIFRILKLLRFSGEANLLLRALVHSRLKVLVFLFTVLTLMVIFGAIMYIVEGPENGFTSIPTSIYWAAVTVATVGYGDITPSTPLGQAIAMLAMITGYSIIAVPTGLISAELMQEQKRQDERSLRTERECLNCGLLGHDYDARYCKRCATRLRDRS